MPVTREQLVKFFDRTPSKVIDDCLIPLNKSMDRFQINNRNRVAMFMAQVGHESGGLTRMEENLNYSAERLLVVFPKYFQGVDINWYARNPQRIASRVYANRMGNGPEISNDGWAYRGRGFIQLTGMNNYVKFALGMGITLQQAVRNLTTPEGAALSAGWFWSTNGLNEIADRGDVFTATKRINGGTNGLAERQAGYDKAMRIFT